MTIVHIGPPHLPILYKLGGATERRMRETAARQAQSGSRVIVFSAEDCSKTTDYFGAEIRSVECRRQGVIRAAEFMAKSLREARRYKPDVIHFHTLPEGAAFTRLFAGGTGARTVLSFDYFVFRRGRSNPLFPWYRRALSSFTTLLPVSEYCRRESAAYWSIPRERMRVLYNGVSMQQFFPDPQAGMARRAALGLGPDEFVILYVGRVCEQKGSDLLVDAYERLRAVNKRVRLVVAGPVGQFGHEGANDLTRRMKELNGIYLGPVDEEILPSIYNLANVFVLPTRNSEMFGMAAIEAQACGKPVVCSDDGGLPEVVRDRMSGLLFPSGNLDALTARLQTLVDDTGLRSRFAVAAVDNAKRFSWETITAQLAQVYQQA